ncbi:MAG: MaoC/PaaZ C-terminal domain-containing protein [Candidatus Methylomirabilales bacterium]
MEKAYFEDCQVGDQVVTSGRTITETDIVLFAAFTGDWLPLHTDAEYARTSMFGERIAHGMLVLVVGSALLFREVYRLLPKSILALYSVEKVRFLAPTRIGDTLRLESEVVKLTTLDERRGLVSVKSRVKNQRNEIVAVFTLKVLVERKPGG